VDTRIFLHAAVLFHSCLIFLSTRAQFERSCMTEESQARRLWSTFDFFLFFFPSFFFLALSFLVFPLLLHSPSALCALSIQTYFFPGRPTGEPMDAARNRVLVPVSSLLFFCPPTIFCSVFPHHVPYWFDISRLQAVRGGVNIGPVFHDIDLYSSSRPFPFLCSIPSPLPPLDSQMHSLACTGIGRSRSSMLFPACEPLRTQARL